jgi:hypothetical protein
MSLHQGGQELRERCPVSNKFSPIVNVALALFLGPNGISHTSSPGTADLFYFHPPLESQIGKFELGAK